MKPLPELDEVSFRSEYFRDLSLQLQKKLDEVGEISQDLQRASEDWQQRYSVFESKVADLSEKEKELQVQVDSLVKSHYLQWITSKLNSIRENELLQNVITCCSAQES